MKPVKHFVTVIDLLLRLTLLVALSPSQNLRSVRGICGTPACKTQSERAVKDAERREARADKANRYRKQAERFVEEVGDVTTRRKRVVGAQNNKRKKNQS